MVTCKNCDYDQLAENARFCSNCGARLEPIPPPAESPQNVVKVDMQVEKIASGGRAVGVDVGEVDGNLTVVQGNLIHIHNPSPELIASLKTLEAMPTQLQPRQEAAAPADRQRLEALEANIDKLLQQMDQAETQGKSVEHVQAGRMQVSRVDLLIKQGILLKSEVEAEMIELAGKRIEERGGLSSAPVQEVDLEELMAGVDPAPYERKLQQAYDNFAEAARLDPGNVEALLHLARTAGELDRNEEAGKLLYQVIQLIGHPADDRQKFYLAQAIYLSAIQGDSPPHPGMLQQARQMFVELGEASWVEQCDQMLGSQLGSPPPSIQTPVVFSPVGQWQVQVSSGVQMQLQYDAQGVCQGYISPGLNRPTSYFNGQWGYDPANQTLQQQGTVDGWSPYNFWLRVVQVYPMAFMAVDAGGFTFMFQRAG